MTEEIQLFGARFVNEAVSMVVSVVPRGHFPLFKFAHVRHILNVVFDSIDLACVLFPRVVIVDRQRSRTLFIGQSITRRANLNK